MLEIRKLFLILLLLCSVHFWRFYIIPDRFHNLTDIASFLIMGISLINVYDVERLRFKSAILLFIAGIGLNILSAYLNNGQGPLDTFLAFGPYFFILIYFFLHEYRIERKFLEDIIIAGAIIYSIFYLWQSYEFPSRLFEGSMFKDRGTIRIKIEGAGFMMLGYFMMLNRYLLQRKVIQIVAVLFFFLILLKGGFRTLTAATVLLSGVIFLRLVKYSIQNYFLIVVAVVVFVGMLQVDSTARIIEGMVNASEKQKDMGDSYIRIMQFDFFTSKYPKNFSYYIFGGGIPGGTGAYYTYMRFLTHEYGFFWVDLGLIGFYYVIGLIALLGLLWFALKAIFIRLPADSLYLNIYFAYLLIVSFTTMEIYRDGMLVTEAITLYLIDHTLDKKDFQSG